MFKMRFALLGVLALFVVSGIGASTASATGGPFWHVNGGKFAQGTQQLKLQLKGIAVLTSTVSLMAVRVECRNSVSEGAAIEGSGPQKPGQAKGRLAFTSCTSVVAGNGTKCKPQEPITTNQTKSHLVTFTGNQSKFAELFEPQQGSTFTNISFLDGPGGTCPIKSGNPFPVKGTVAAELLPKESEVQEGQLVFPETPITKVFLFENEQKVQPDELGVSLALGANEAHFIAGYGARLSDNKVFGVWST
ncbi:MAG TPA: hypothetical protein VIC06_12800 [Solirubrobacteraceae bacterium]|jgi:hypothetical protein